MSGHTPSAEPADPVARALARAAGVLPDQGPIGVFVHHNTLHAYQHLPFHAGVQAGAEALGARPYLSLAEFRQFLRRGRIDDDHLRTEIARALSEGASDAAAVGLTRAELWHVLLTTDCEVDDAAGLRYTIDQGLAPHCEDILLWNACLARVRRGPAAPAPAAPLPRRHRDVLVSLGADDPDVAVHGELVRLGSGFLDHGHARASLPRRDDGFLVAVSALYADGGAAPRACPGVDVDMSGLVEARVHPLAIIRDVLGRLGVTDNEVEPFVFATALALPGWTGMFSRLERHPDEHVGANPPTLAEFIAVRLRLEFRAIQKICAQHHLPIAWRELRALAATPAVREPELDAAVLWHVARAARWSTDDVSAASDADLARLWNECARFPDVQRRRVFHEAFERTYRVGILDALATRRALPCDEPTERPRAQFVFCIDEREESIRRAIEEQHPLYTTFGVAGFFGVAMDYRGLYDREAAAHCPVVVTPAHEVHERPVFTQVDWHQFRLRLRDRWHEWERRVARASRTLSGGAGLSFLLGPVSAAMTLARVLLPRHYSVMNEQVKAKVAPRPVTRLSTFRSLDEPLAASMSPAASPLADAAGHGERDERTGKPIGFSLTEAVDRVSSVLRNIGLVHTFAPVIVVLGHGSTSLNNPHESAHDCGACGGRRGGANARLFADIANRPDVREGVRQRGIAIPADCWFIGALHDTADDSITCYDLEALPTTHATVFQEAWQALERARQENALERSRRFDDAPLTLTPAEALAHVKSRSTLLAQPRPEYGHCTNSICIVGRRAVTRGLHLDRRAFLVSYDASTDPDGSVIERILAAVGPVGAGISLEYYFSAVDNETFGCGTKLPHNVTGLIGVMNGHQSDLRTGLPIQMVEIHEPMRLLLIVEATPAALLRVAGRQPEVAELVVNAWVQLVSLDPETGAMAEFRDGTFVPYVPQPAELPIVNRSPEWHMRSREHLRPALVRSAMPPSVAAGRPGQSPAALAGVAHA